MVYTTLIPVICGSGDVNAFPSSTVSDFSVELADALMLDGQWQCRLDSITMPNPNYNAGAGVTSNSIIVTLPGVLDGSIIGSTKIPLLFRTGPMLETNTAQRYVHVQDQSPLPIWRDVQPSIVNTLRVTCTQINGVALPETDPTAPIGSRQNFTTVSLVFRKIGD